MGREVAELYRALPSDLRCQVPEHGSRRVLNAIAGELQHRSPAELIDRIGRNWEHWRYRLGGNNPVRDPVALAIRLTRRGLDCPDVRCEDGHQLDLDAPCKACALAAAERAATRTQAHAEEPAGHRLDRSTASRRAPATWSSDDETIGEPQGSATAAIAAAATRGVDARPYAALARTLLKARTCAEREEILAAHQARAHSA